MSPTPQTWRCLPFDALHARTLYALLQLRTEVFVMEQHCVFQDMDGADAQCFHLLGEGARGLEAYARLVPAGLKFNEASIGRVVTLPAARGGGLGHVLMREAVRALHGLWGMQPIRIGAQAHLQPFYRQHGFEPSGPMYIEDGIDHIEMLRPA
ncbi:GNAT family N-acetyltransferase [Hydrogenophaga sp. PBL-H3]|uniref:GNAT family N-acetyltransferase n=1 Tax=Hydrogenophaga sp. PBL-H3 TaxID=434010 RepID=UPI001F1C00F2|nr:GNAT family N-acetyltransferase [Hydrogenophaga sp. PBL-H3]